MIRMINGVTCIGGKLLDNRSGPFAADPETEANLVRRGAAEYCDVELPCVADTEEAATELISDEASPVPGELAETADLDAMSAAELRELCDERGIDAPKRATKAQLIALLS